MRRISVCLIVISILWGAGQARAGATPVGAAPAGRNAKPPFIVTVRDSADGSPVTLARVALWKGTMFIEGKVTDAQGKAEFRDIASGRYRLNVHYIGYNDYTDSIVIDDAHRTADVALVTMSLGEVTVTAQRVPVISKVQVKTGNQVFETETYHAPPTTRISTLIQQNVAGAARAPTGEVHIRGQHGELTYYIDGIPIPMDPYGGLNEIIDPGVIDHATFFTGGFPAEYGGQMAAIADIQTRVPAGGFHVDASTYAGSYLVFNGASPFVPGANVASGRASSAPGDTLGGRVGPLRALNSDGQTLSVSTHVENFGMYLSGSRQETDRRIDTPVPTLYNDHGFDYFLYGKFEYLLDENNYLTANLNYGKTSTEVPFDSVEQGFAPDHQSTGNSFQTLSYYHTFSSTPDNESSLFAGVYSRQGNLLYSPSAISPATFQFAGDTTLYALAENRSFTAVGVRTTYSDRLSHRFQFSAGFNVETTAGTEEFTSRDSAGNAGPHSSTDYAGSDFGMFVQSDWHPYEWTSFDAGIRYDQHIAPDTTLQWQISPRIRWNLYFDEADNAYLYYGRLFMPTSLESIRFLASNVGTGGVATIPERDDFFEAAYMHTFDLGVTGKLSVFHKYASPGVDDQTIGASAVKTEVNIAQVYITGIELGLSYSSPETPLSGYVNAALTHAYGSGAITGGFLPIASDGAATDLDHDQRLSVVASVNYQPAEWFANLTGIYGSGLTNGNPNDLQYQTGLFDFNAGAHVTPSVIFNFSGGYIVHLGGGATFEPSVYFTNLFDSNYLLKGAYFSGASYGERRNVVLNLAYHI